MIKVILASASPRRKELLSRIVGDFSVIPAQGEEKAEGGLSPEEYVCALAEAKCGEVFEKNSGCLVIGSDTAVVYGGKILGKPKSKADAVQTLKTLSGKTHSVITGVCIRYKDKKLVKCETTGVTFNGLSEDFINSYVNGGSPMDKAGSYGIQDGGVVKSYNGSYTNVVGLPVELVEKMMEEVLNDE